MKVKRPERGVTLVELMIALVLGLVLIIAIGSIFVGSRQTYRVQEAFSQVQENGRLAHYLLNNVIRLAGYVPVPREHTDPTTIFDDVDYRAIRGWESAAPEMPGVASASDAFDAITVAYGGSPDGSVSDCMGNPICYRSDPSQRCRESGDDLFQIVTNTFYLDDEAPSSLMCSSVRYDCNPALEECAISASQAQPLFLGVGDLQFRYGIDTNNDLAVDQWVNADAVPNWNRVLAVEATVIAESEDAVERGPSDEDLVVEGRLRRPFTITIAIRNRLTP